MLLMCTFSQALMFQYFCNNFYSLYLLSFSFLSEIRISQREDSSLHDPLQKLRPLLPFLLAKLLLLFFMFYKTLRQNIIIPNTHKRISSKIKGPKFYPQLIYIKPSSLSQFTVNSRITLQCVHIGSLQNVTSMLLVGQAMNDF